MFDGSEVTERNCHGELWVRAPNVMKGYWRNEKATKETKTTDGWLLTGDIAFVDDDGKIHVVDRMKVCFMFLCFCVFYFFMFKKLMTTGIN